MLRRVEEESREEEVIVAQLQHVEAKEGAVVALSEASLLGLDKHGRIDGERGRGGRDCCLRPLPSRPGGSGGVLEVPLCDEEGAEVREDLRGREEVELVLGREGVERIAKACGRGTIRW